MQPKQNRRPHRNTTPCRAGQTDLAHSLSGHQRRPSVALLIDGENCSPDVASQVLKKAEDYGPVRVRRVYANWAVPANRAWIEPVARYTIQPIHHDSTATGKNATDILLAIDAMEFLHGGEIDCFCLVASDSDYTPLVRRLRAAGRKVVVIGRAKTMPSLIEACDEFVGLERLISSAELTAPPQRTLPLAQPMTAPAQARAQAPWAEPASATAPTATSEALASTNSTPSDTSAPIRAATRDSATHVDPGPLLLDVWEKVRREHGEVFLYTLVAEIKRLQPGLQARHYGCADLTHLVRQRTDLFAVRPDAITSANLIVLRAGSGPTPTQEQVPVPRKRIDVRTLLLLEAAWREAPRQDEWLFLGAFGHQLKQIAPDFKPSDYGYRNLGSLIRALPDYFELRQRGESVQDVRFIGARSSVSKAP